MPEKCEWCGEERKYFVRYIIKTKELPEEEYACNECVGNWFIECPEDIKYFMTIEIKNVET